MTKVFKNLKKHKEGQTEDKLDYSLGRCSRQLANVAELVCTPRKQYYLNALHRI
jgi:hypothetical protein